MILRVSQGKRVEERRAAKFRQSVDVPGVKRPEYWALMLPFGVQTQCLTFPGPAAACRWVVTAPQRWLYGKILIHAYRKDCIAQQWCVILLNSVIVKEFRCILYATPNFNTQMSTEAHYKPLLVILWVWFSPHWFKVKYTEWNLSLNCHVCHKYFSSQMKIFSRRNNNSSILVSVQFWRIKLELV